VFVLAGGFWYDRKAAADAAQKAFVKRRDFGLLGILGLYWATGSFEFEVMGDRLQDSVQSGSLSNFLAVLFAILVFLGPVAKSAQFPCTSGYRMQWKVRHHLGPNPCRNDGGSWGVPDCPDVPSL